MYVISSPNKLYAWRHTATQPCSVAQSEDLWASTVTDVGHQNDFGLAVVAKLTNSDKFQFLI